MRTKLLGLLVVIAAVVALVVSLRPARSVPREETFSSFDPPGGRYEKQLLPANRLKFEQAELPQVLQLYQELSHRTVVRSAGLPSISISIQNETPLTRREALQLLDTLLAQNGVIMIPLGTKFVKAVPSAQASTEGAPVIELPAEQLPESSSYMLYVVKLKVRKPREVAPAMQPFAKMPNSIMAIDDAGILILRDYSTNIRRMLEVIDKIEHANPSMNIGRLLESLQKTKQPSKP